MNPNPSTGPTPKFLLGLIVGIFAVRAIFLGAYPLLDPTEGRYAEIAREMVTTGDWIVPHLEEGFPFLGKPPLMFWVTALSYKIFGISEWTSRFPSYFLCCLTLGVVFVVGRRIQGTQFALLAMLFLSTTALFFGYAGYVATDTALLITVTTALSCFLWMVHSQDRMTRRLVGYLFFVFLGLSLLAKGLVGAVLICGPIFLWFAWNRDWRMLRDVPWFTGLLLTALVAVPWHILCERESPGFLEYYIIGEHWKRFTVSNWEGDRYGSPHQFPRGMIVLFFVVTALPWSLVLGVSLFQRPRLRSIVRSLMGDRVFSLVVFWFLVPLMFFSISRNVMFTYTLPALPAFALLLARILQIEAEEEPASSLSGASSNLLAGLALVVPTVFLIIAVFIIPVLSPNRSQKELATYFLSLGDELGGRLVYTDQMPPSGDFYTKGRAVDVPDEDPAAILSHLRDFDQDIFAIELGDERDFPQEAYELTIEVGRFGKYILRKEFDPSAWPLDFELPATPEVVLPPTGPRLPTPEKSPFGS